MVGVDAAIANALRRILLAEVSIESYGDDHYKNQIVNSQDLIRHADRA